MTSKAGGAQRWTMSSWATHPDLPRLVLWMCLAVLVLCLCVARVSQIHMDDDNLYLAYAAQSEGVSAAALEESLIDRIATKPHCEESVHRLKLRQRYSRNYGGYADVQGALQHAAALFVPAGPESVVAGTLAVKVLFFLLLSAALALAAFRHSSRELELAVLCSFIALIALDVAIAWVPTVLRVKIDRPADTILEMISSFFVISKTHSYFGVTPRNAALLLFVAALLFKWQGRSTAAVLALLAMAPIHQTYGGLGLVLFGATSAVSRPGVFAGRLPRVLLVGVGLIYVARERFFEHFGVWAQIGFALGLVAVALIFFRAVCSAAFAALRRRCLGRWLEHEVSLDAAILGGLVVLVTLVSLIGDQLANDAIARRFVWSNLPIRTLSFVRFPVAIACFLLVWRRTQWHMQGRRPIWFAATGAFSCIALSGLLLSEVDERAWKRLRREVRGHLGAPRDPDVLKPRKEEDRIYAHLTMVAAGQMDATTADVSIVRDRQIKCPRRGKRR